MRVRSDLSHHETRNDEKKEDKNKALDEMRIRVRIAYTVHRHVPILEETLRWS